MPARITPSKDFRTWAGTVLAAQLLRECDDFESETQAKKNIVGAIERVAAKLGNTKAVCRKCYIHPAVLEAYMERTMIKQMAQRARRVARTGALNESEAAVLALLQRRIAAELKRAI